MKSLLIEIAVFILSSIAACIFIIFATPCVMFISMYEAYEDDRASSKLHQDIDDFLREQREQDTDDYYQIHAW